MNLAAIDIGTNSVLLTVAAHDGSAFHPLKERAEITRLGRGVDRTGKLSPEGMDATLAVVRTYVEEAGQLGVPASRVVCVATSAARDAQNGRAFLAQLHDLGLAPEIIGGEREAALTFLAARRDFGAGGGSLAIIDIGGGSTEVAVDLDRADPFASSFPIGSVRQHERWATARDKIDADVVKAFIGVPKLAQGTPVVGVAGTWTTLATLHLGLSSYDAERVHGAHLPLTALHALEERLWSMTLEERLQLPGIQAGRADVIQVGALIALRAMQALGANEVIASDRGVRWGLMYERESAP